MKTFMPKEAKSGIKVESKLKALYLKKVWNKFNLSDRNLLSSYKNYYDVNGFLANHQYKCLVKMYEEHVENYTEFQQENK